MLIAPRRHSRRLHRWRPMILLQPLMSTGRSWCACCASASLGHQRTSNGMSASACCIERTCSVRWTRPQRRRHRCEARSTTDGVKKKERRASESTRGEVLALRPQLVNDGSQGVIRPKPYRSRSKLLHVSARLERAGRPATGLGFSCVLGHRVRGRTCLSSRDEMTHMTPHEATDEIPQVRRSLIAASQLLKDVTSCCLARRSAPLGPLEPVCRTSPSRAEVGRRRVLAGSLHVHPQGVPLCVKGDRVAAG